MAQNTWQSRKENMGTKVGGEIEDGTPRVDYGGEEETDT